MKSVVTSRIVTLVILLLVTGSTGILFSQNVNNGEIRGGLSQPRIRAGLCSWEPT
jgi:hypothetical protein